MQGMFHKAVEHLRERDSGGGGLLREQRRGRHARDGIRLKQNRDRIVAGAAMTSLLGIGAELAAPTTRTDGDRIIIDAVTGVIDLEVPEDVLESRHSAWSPRVTDYGSGALWRYAQNVGPAWAGAVTHPGAQKETHVFADI